MPGNSDCCLDLQHCHTSSPYRGKMFNGSGYSTGCQTHAPLYAAHPLDGSTSRAFRFKGKCQISGKFVLLPQSVVFTLRMALWWALNWFKGMEYYLLKTWHGHSLPQLFSVRQPSTKPTPGLNASDKEHTHAWATEWMIPFILPLLPKKTRHVFIHTSPRQTCGRMKHLHWPKTHLATHHRNLTPPHPGNITELDAGYGLLAG